MLNIFKVNNMSTRTMSISYGVFNVNFSVRFDVRFQHMSSVDIGEFEQFVINWINLYQLSVAFYTETRHLIRRPNQITGFYMKCNTRLE